MIMFMTWKHCMHVLPGLGLLLRSEEALDAYTAAANLYRGDYPRKCRKSALPERERLCRHTLKPR